MKDILKQLEKEKISVVELRHQVNEKDKNLIKVTTELKKSNTIIENSYE